MTLAERYYFRINGKAYASFCKPGMNGKIGVHPIQSIFDDSFYIDSVIYSSKYSQVNFTHSPRLFIEDYFHTAQQWNRGNKLEEILK